MTVAPHYWTMNEFLSDIHKYIFQPKTARSLEAVARLRRWMLWQPIATGTCPSPVPLAAQEPYYTHRMRVCKPMRAPSPPPTPATPSSTTSPVGYPQPIGWLILPAAPFELLPKFFTCVSISRSLQIIEAILFNCTFVTYFLLLDLQLTAALSNLELSVVVSQLRSVGKRVELHCTHIDLSTACRVRHPQKVHNYLLSSRIVNLAKCHKLNV